jgi:hypothetical protein
MKVGAETLAEVLNKLIEPLSYKTMGFGVVICVLLMSWVKISSSFLLRSRNRNGMNGEYVSRSRWNDDYETKGRRVDSSYDRHERRYVMIDNDYEIPKRIQ